jgi:hypothetical protein
MKRKFKRKRKGFTIVGRWARSISNHIYWCAASSNGDGEMVQQKYASILNHISNIHEGHGEKFPQCAHDEVCSPGDNFFMSFHKILCLMIFSISWCALQPVINTDNLIYSEKLIL